ncbi:unnamed protein product [Cyprideis torosa]|uniref:Uncharacterized protein n=1 Tax=Cyprideis torosa TaxID=163714 RepID=A0A7R8ZW10_9CRUS|nr:unnamed protein product [Cyprideis torosa]CAG0911265.1 unnamed protein product [Cyprideis torosa]
MGSSSDPAESRLVCRSGRNSEAEKARSSFWSYSCNSSGASPVAHSSVGSCIHSCLFVLFSVDSQERSCPSFYNVSPHE